MKKIRVYDQSGRERFLPAGATVPAGWFRDGNPPVRLEEDHVVVQIEEPGNPWEQGPARLPSVRLELRPLRTAKVADEYAGDREAQRLARMLQEAGLRCTVSYSQAKGKFTVRDIATYAPWMEVADEAELLARLSELRPRIEEAARQQRRRTAEYVVKEAGVAAGFPAGKLVTWTSDEWIPHEDFGGLDGGDYASGERWEWSPWALRAIERICAGEDPEAVCAEEIARAKESLCTPATSSPSTGTTGQAV